jgi:hypothetical protein
MNSPKPYHNTSNKLKAFVIGCDPTAFKDGERLEFEYVFGIKKDKRYFAGINANLNLLGLDQEYVYIQNLVTEPQDEETGKNKKWKGEAVKQIKLRKEEFDRFDPSCKLPVFLTSELLYDVLLNEDIKRKTPSEIYSSIEVVIPAEENKLSRPLVALYRHFNYSMKNKPEYARRLIEKFKFSKD